MRSIFSRFFSQKPSPGIPDLTAEEIRNAAARVHTILPVSPLTHSPTLSEMTGRSIYFKWENKFKTGSFKERGVVNIFSQLTLEEKAQGVCAASAGNHALALSYHAQQFGIPCLIVMPRHAALVKVQSTRASGAEVILHGESFDEAYLHAQTLARERTRLFVPAFDDPRIIAGQGTCGAELLEQLKDFDSVIVPIGGGGLASGIGMALKAARPEIFILGVESEWAVHRRMPGAARPSGLFADTSIADGIAVKTLGKLTEPIVRNCVDKIVSIPEATIAKSIIRFLECERAVVEGAGAVALGALLDGHLPEKYQRVVVVVSGSNIDVNMLSRLIEWDMGERDRLMRINVSVPDRPGSLSSVAGMIAQLGANVLEVNHDRSFSRIPGNVDITFLVEVRNRDHKEEIFSSLQERGIVVQELA